MHTCWLLLSPVHTGGAAGEEGGAVAGAGDGFPYGLCVPLAVNIGLPDYVIDLPSYEAALRVPWAPCDRFRCFVGTGAPEATAGPMVGRKPGNWLTGAVMRVHMRVEVSSGDAGRLRHVDVDPWEAYEVEWDPELRRK